ncbi:hypothetical protein [uncultured Duncaniella sp.]|uniref:hypothetical protein n=1 Tax=uncultured Duncaniella sp. TaxID=2768039 RepID=UPI0026745493|nr:hypothetical protein [uncultured Duncaniella sp.]
MVKRNLLFIEGNRQKIDKTNIKEAYQKISTHGYIPTMPIEYLPMDKAIVKLGGRELFKVTVTRRSGQGEATISNFDIKTEVVKAEDYALYDGVCIDGQHRTLAMLIGELCNTRPTYSEVAIPDNMDILSYVALRNNGKTWKNQDFTHSGISTQSNEVDHIIKQCEQNKEDDAFFYSIYTLPTITIRATQIKGLQLGYKTVADFRNLQLSPETTSMGDRVYEAIKENKTLTSDRCNGRLGAALKKFYVEKDKDFNTLIAVIGLIDNDTWEAHFTPEKGHSMEIKGYTDALHAVWAKYEENQ